MFCTPRVLNENHFDWHTLCMDRQLGHYGQIAWTLRTLDTDKANMLPAHGRAFLWMDEGSAQPDERKKIFRNPLTPPLPREILRKR